MQPVARTKGLILRELPDELVIYDTARHQAHCLNASAALVFKHSDGKTSVAQLVKQLRREVSSAADETWVRLALERLEEAHLLERAPGAANAPSRRDVLSRLGWAAAALPVVMTVVAPTPAEAAATCNPTCAGSPALCTPCQSTPGDCNSGVCCGSGPANCLPVGSCGAGSC